MRRGQTAAVLLDHPAFTRLWAGLSISYLGDQFATIALLWFVLQLTGSGAAVGLVIFLFNFPAIVTGPMIGQLLDRYQPRLVMAIDNAARATLIAAIPALSAFGVLQLWHIYLLAFAAGALQPATLVGVRTYIPHLVPDELLDHTNALWAGSVQFTSLVGPALAGYLVASLGGPFALWVDAASFVVMSIIAFRLPQSKS